MGLVLKVDLDTSGGSTKEAYIRIETCRINKVQAQLEFTTTCWINKKAAGKFYRKYLSDPLTNAGGLIKQEVVYYSDAADINGTEVVLANYYKVPLTTGITVEEPIFEKQFVKKEVPYVSFDENGDEIEKIKIVTKEVDVQVGSNKIKKQLIDYSLMERPFELAYKHLKNELAKYFPKSSIVKE